MSPTDANSDAGRGSIATLANGVTLIRALSIPLLWLAITTEAWLAAAGLFTLAVVTDLADGRLARRRGEASSLGGLLDHSTDALFCSVGLGALACAGIVPAVLPFLVATAFLQYVLDSRSIAGQPLRASFVGRWNGIAYFALIGIPVVRDALALPWPGDTLVLALGWALVVSTLLSMADRGWALATRSR